MNFPSPSPYLWPLHVIAWSYAVQEHPRTLAHISNPTAYTRVSLVHTRADVARVEHLRANLARLWKQFTSRRLSSQPWEGVGREQGGREAGGGGDGAARDGTGAL